MNTTPESINDTYDDNKKNRFMDFIISHDNRCSSTCESMVYGYDIGCLKDCHEYIVAYAKYLSTTSCFEKLKNHPALERDKDHEYSVYQDFWSKLRECH